MSPRVETLLDTARSRLVRLTPEQAAHAVTYERALLVDTRPAADRERHGAIPGALVVDRNVLEWRLDPTSPHRLEQADDQRRTVIVFCNEGYASSLAAVSLRDLGLVNATDLIGGFHAWGAAGLPVTGTAPTAP